MRTRGFLTVLAVTVLLLPSYAAAQEVCSAATVKGIYALTTTGWINLGSTPAGPFAPVTGQGRFVNEVLPDGTLVSKSIGDVLLSLAGNQLRSTQVSTNITVNPNCTGTITYHVTFPGWKEEDTNYSFLILDGGKELLAFDTGVGRPLGMVATCTLRLMSRNTTHLDETQ